MFAGSRLLLPVSINFITMGKSEGVQKNVCPKVLAVFNDPTYSI